MKLLRVQKQNLSDSIAEQLRRNIFAGDPKPGDKLPPERDLAESLGTNRNTLREAIRELESLGLVSVRQGDGVRVADFRSEAQLNLLPYFLLENPHLPETLAVLADLLFLRRSILGMAAHRMASQPNPTAVWELKQLLALQQLSHRTQGEMLKTDLEFFACLIRGANSLVMRWLFNSFVPIYNQVLESFPDLWMVPDGYLLALAKIIRSIEQADPESASANTLSYFETIDPAILELASQMATQLEQPLGAILAMSH